MLFGKNITFYYIKSSAGSIRLLRVILLRSDIRLAPSYIRYAGFMANRISLKPYGFNITIAIAIISLFDLAKNFT